MSAMERSNLTVEITKITNKIKDLATEMISVENLHLIATAEGRHTAVQNCNGRTMILKMEIAKLRAQRAHLADDLHRLCRGTT